MVLWISYIGVLYSSIAGGTVDFIHRSVSMHSKWHLVHGINDKDTHKRIVQFFIGAPMDLPQLMLIPTE